MPLNHAYEDGRRRFRGSLDGHTNDTVAGWVADPDDPQAKVDVELLLDGAPVGSVAAAFPRGDVLDAGLGDGRNGFVIALPPAGTAGNVEARVRAVSSGEPIGQPLTIDRLPSPHLPGLSQSAARDLLSESLLWVDTCSLGADAVELRGCFLPPDGDPSAYSVQVEGHQYEFERHGFRGDLGLPSSDPGAGSYGPFWFWPNAEWSGWRLTVDLSQRPRTAEDSLVVECRPMKGTGSVERLVVPLDRALWTQQPADDLLNRVQVGDSTEVSPVRAASHLDRLLRTTDGHMARPCAGSRVLDWGCGWGRLTRVLPSRCPGAEVWGADVDEEALQWAAAAFPDVTFANLPLYPPTELPGAHFDLIIGLSVMTHLKRDAQRAWLVELHRLLRPGGVAVLTFNGDAALAATCQSLPAEVIPEYRATGFAQPVSSRGLDQVVPTDYWRDTFQSDEDVRANWAAPLDLLEVGQALVGYQSIAVLSKRKNAPGQ